MRRTSLDAKQRRLGDVPAFAGSTPAELARLGQVLDVVTVPAGTVILRRDRLGHEFHVVLDGTVRVERDGNTLATLTRGSVLGELALLDRTARNADVIAETPVVLATGMRRDFPALLEEFPALARQIRDTYASRVTV